MNFSQEVNIEQPQARDGKRKLAILLIGIFLVAGAGYLVKQKRYVSVATKTSVGMTTSEQKKEIADALAAVGKLILLPQGDDPVLARVEDPEALVKQQAFFAGAEKGDILLIFPKSQRAILYSNGRNLIINSGPIIAGDQNSAATQPGVVPENVQGEVPAGALKK